MASASACLAGLSKRAALCADRSIDSASLAVAMARGITATLFVHTLLLCAHGPTVLTNPEPCSAARS